MNYCELLLLVCPLIFSSAPGFFVHCLSNLIYEMESNLTETTETLTIQHYLQNIIDHPSYDKRIAPDGQSGEGSAVDVNVTIYFSDISMLNEQTMDFEAQFYIQQYWVDPRLKYNISGVNRILLTNVDKIWTPNLFFTNEKEGYLNKITQPNMLCRILPDGNVYYSIKLYEKLACKMDLQNFPHDSQKCNVIVESYGYSADELNIGFPESDGMMIAATDSITASNFDIIDVSYTKNSATYSSGTYSELRGTLTFKRNAKFFGTKMYTPFIFLVVLSWISFWISSNERYPRLMLLLVVLYMMVNMTSELDRWIPYTPYAKASDIWIGFCQALVYAAFLEVIFVAIYFKKEPNGDNSGSTLEMRSNAANEGKDLGMCSSNSFKSFLSHLNMMACGRRGPSTSAINPVDRICRFAFPLFFVLFNIIYWSSYGSA